MARINLLPWRENLRKKRQRDFGIATFIAVLLTAASCAGVFFYIDSLEKFQKRRNALLKQEIKAMDMKISEIAGLEKTKANLIARMNVIQELQISRPQVVHLFDQVVTTIPDGTFLTKLSQKGQRLTLSGRAQSNARVSAYMRNIEDSDWLNRATLQVITNKNISGSGLSEFTLTAKQRAPKAATAGDKK